MLHKQLNIYITRLGDDTWAVDYEHNFSYVMHYVADAEWARCRRKHLSVDDGQQHFNVHRSSLQVYIRTAGRQLYSRHNKPKNIIIRYRCHMIFELYARAIVATHDAVETGWELIGPGQKVPYSSPSTVSIRPSISWNIQLCLMSF